MKCFMIQRQIPYAIGQFTVNEFCHEATFRSLSDEKKKALQNSKAGMFTVNLGSGIIAGFAAAILSQVCLFFFFPLLLYNRIGGGIPPCKINI